MRTFSGCQLQRPNHFLLCLYRAQLVVEYTFLNIGVSVEELTREIHVCLPEPLLEDCPEAIKHDLAKAGGNQSIGTKTDI